VSLFRIIKYSSVLFFLGKYKVRLFRVVAVLLFAIITSLVYQDVVDYLELRHPDSVIYALTAKIVIVYGALIFVLLQFRPDPKESSSTAHSNEILESTIADSQAPQDRLAQLEDISQKDTLRRRYDRVIDPDQ